MPNEETTNTARINIREDDEIPTKKLFDPFMTKTDDLLAYDGLEKNFKRRSIRKAYKGQEDTGSKAKTAAEVNEFGYGMFDVIAPPYNLDELASFYETNGPNHAAVNAKVANIVGLGYDFVASALAMDALGRASSATALEKAQRRLESEKRKLHEWFEEVNDTDTFTHVLEKAMTDVEATGNGYLEIGRKVNGEIGYIGHIPSTTIRVRRSRDGFVQLAGQKVIYFRNFQDTDTPNRITNDPRPNEIIHIKKYSPRSTYYGVPDVLASAEAVVGDRLSARYNIDYFENKAVPRYIVVLKGAKLSEDAEGRLFRFLQAGLRGQNHRTLYVPLPSDSQDNKVDFKLEPVENGIQDSSFEKYHKANREDVLVSHTTPYSKVGGSPTTAVAAALAADRTFKEQVARPAQRNLEKLINKIVGELTDLLKFKLNELTLTDENTQSQIDERYLRMQVIVPNEVRQRMGLPAREGGDKPVELKPQQQADQRAEGNNSRQRDAERTNNASDDPNSPTGRNPKGEGRVQT